jgi:peptidylprolyl isomerase
MRRLRAAAPFLLALFLAPATASAADVIARMGTTDVTVDDLRAYLETLSAEEQAALTETPALAGRMVRLYLSRRLVLQEARAAKFDQRPETKAALERVRDEALLTLYLQAVAKVPEDYPSEAELTAAYEANPTAFLMPRRYRLAQIYIAAEGAGDKDGAARLEKARKEASGDFAAAAKAYSDTPAEAEKGGEIGWVPENQIVPDIRQAVTGLSKGGVSEPLRTDDGWHIVKLLDTRPAGVRPLAEVRDELTRQLRQKRAEAERQAYLAGLLREHPVTVNELALSKLTATAK